MAGSLDKITVRGFKSIRECQLELRPITLLIGGNGAGKSNLIQVFGLLNEIVRENLQNYVQRQGGPEGLLHLGQKTTSHLDFHLVFGRNGYELKLTPSRTDSLFIEDEIAWFWGEGHDKPYEERIGSSMPESQLAAAALRKPGRVAEHVLTSISSWKIYHFHDTSETAKVKQLCDVDDNEFLRPDAGNLAAFLWRLESSAPSSFKQITAAIRNVAPFFQRFQLRERPLSPEKMRLEWRENGTDTYFNAHSLSDGTLRFICLATLLLQPELPSMIILDEPELGLHPYAIHVLAGLLRAASQKTRVVVATQSVTLVNQFAPQDVVVVERENGASVFRHADEQFMGDWLDEYGLGDLWEKNVLGGRPSAQ